MARRGVEVERAKAVGIWIRVSTEDQAHGESPEHHEARARHYADAKGWKIVEVYNLSGVSGKSVMEHPEAKRMLDDVQKGRITGLIFSKLARLARSTKQLLEFSDIFREHGADLISLQESIDTSSPAGRLLYTVISALAEWEREEISSRVAASVPIRAKLGKPTGGSAPYGYAWVSKKLVIDPKEAPVRKLMYELFLEHRRKKAVARLLNERGHRTRNGSRFSDTTVERLLRDPIAKGIRRANYTKTTNSKRAWQLKPESEWVLTEAPAIVSEELWMGANAVLDERRHTKKKPGPKPVHLFAGYTYCGCGKAMYVPSNSPKYICQACRNKIAIVDLEGIFYDQIRGFLGSPEDVTAYLAAANERMQEKEKLLRVVRKEHEENAKEMDRLYRLYMKDGISIDDFRGRYRTLEERQKQIGAELPRTQAELDLMKINLLSSEDIVSETRDFYERWPALLVDEKRRVVEAIVERITIGTNDEIDIALNYLPFQQGISDDGKATRAHGFIAQTREKREK